MSEKEKQAATKYFCKKLNKGFLLEEPCIELIEELEKLGFDFNDASAVNKAYLECTLKPEKLKDLVKILFNQELTDEEIKKLSISNVVRPGIMDFLTGYGLLLS